MSAPPGVSARTEAPEQRRGGGTERVQAFSNLARRVADDNGLPISQNRIQRLVRRYIAERRADIDFRTWFIAYADPTGETAVRNVMKGAGRG